MAATSAALGVPTAELVEQWKRGALDVAYVPGMQAVVVSEALRGAVPEHRNSPQTCPMGLYAEQLSGTSFTTPRAKNQFAWLYRTLPCVKHQPFRELPAGRMVGDFAADAVVTPNQLRWRPVAHPTRPTMFHEGWTTMCGAGSAEGKSGMACHVYTCNASMARTAFCDADGDLLIVPQEGDLLVRTEMGVMELAPRMIGLIPRGVRFAVHVKGASRGYLAEVFESHFVIPDLGPIGANGLANARDFETVTASFEDVAGDFRVVHKFGGKLWEAAMDHSPFNVVGWHGNYSPYRYDLRHFVVVNSVSIDHLDPSIFTVLTAPTAERGVACCDFVVFPPRWSVHTGTFRPPYYHRNVMSEYMGNIMGTYEAKPDGFVPGGGSLHSCMTPHGPDAATFDKASKEPQVPVPPKPGNWAFMFESTYMFRVTKHALDAQLVQADYFRCWQPLRNNFSPTTSNSKL